MAEQHRPERVKPETIESFDAYVREAERLLDQSLRAGAFLWFEGNPRREKTVRAGEVLTELWEGAGPHHVPSGVIHDWVGAVFAPGSTIQLTLARIQDYDNHKIFYKPEVVESKLVSRNGNFFKIYLRLQKKKIVTVVLDTDHDVRYTPVDATRWYCRSYTTRVAEVESAGRPDEKVGDPDMGYGFLWRLNSYWRFQERDGGVYIQCRAITLTRDIPLGLGWIIEPLIRSLPGESLISTLRATRDALARPA